MVLGDKLLERDTRHGAAAAKASAIDEWCFGMMVARFVHELFVFMSVLKYNIKSSTFNQSILFVCLFYSTTTAAHSGTSRRRGGSPRRAADTELQSSRAATASHLVVSQRSAVGTVRATSDSSGRINVLFAVSMSGTNIWMTTKIRNENELRVKVD